MKITDFYKLDDNNINFVNIYIKEDKDIQLFIDPFCILWTSDNYWSKKFIKTIDSFTLSLFDSLKNNNYNTTKQLLSHGSEAKQLKLGYSNKQYGTGNTKESLYDIFSSIPTNLLQNPNANINDFLITCDNFAEDGMSDLLGNILLKNLYDFTVMVAKKLNLPLSSKKQFIGYYWDCISSSWLKLYDFPLIINGLIVLLTPINIVRKNNIVSSERFFQYQVLEYHQNLHFETKSTLCKIKIDKNGNEIISPPNKNDVREFLLKTKGLKKNDLIKEILINDNNSYNDFYRKINSRKNKFT